ncbi:neuronal acetylcholine receptor subunit alpha-7-like [Ruditapes philippinarum]|uniref:neuronal acetylcholine receptor subunit alpha-7-like n=1 Tax=Ruditapes philippinarum TaxID=129788 RepID=UPI00295BA5F1|nr:neuronal acetylcholine receptor subunit alpha-7-like [Ruditapes philippinarum]
MDKCFITRAIIIFLFLKESQQGTNEKRLFHDLFQERYYSPLERPVENESLPIRVNFTLVLQQIIDVDEKNQIIHTNIWLQMKWRAANLMWDPYEYGGIEAIPVPAKLIWTPDILLYNSADDKFDGTYHSNVVVRSDGSCLWVPPGMLRSTCSIDITWFPFDDQHCDLKFGSWTYDGRMLDLQMEDPNGGSILEFRRNGEWELIGVPGHRHVQEYDCCEEFYIDLVYTIHIRRRTLYYGFNIIIPCLLISSMSLLLFLLPPDAGEKISLGVTILLSLMVFLLLVAETMPPTSDALPLIGIYFCCIMVMTSLSVLFTVVVLNFHYRGPETHVMPSWVKFGINVVLAKALCMTRPTTEKRRQSILQRHRLGDVQMHERMTTHSLLPNLLESEEEYRACAENGLCGLNTLGASDWIRQAQACNINMTQTSGDDTGSTKYVNDKSEFASPNLVAILVELKKITSKLKEDEEDTNIKNEWKFAAIVIDRLCLWICLAATLISTIAILSSAPHLVA